MKNRKGRSVSAASCHSDRPVEGYGLCLNCYNRARYSLRSARERRDRWRKGFYGLSPDEFDTLWDSQGGRCAICRIVLVDGGPSHARDTLHVDHDHKSGAVRGLLCAPCNTMLGQAEDDPERLSAAIAYLKGGDRHS